MSRFKAGAEIKHGQGITPFLWGAPAVLFNTANHDGSLSTPMINEGTTGSVWDLVVQTGYSKYWAIKNYNWGSRPNVGTVWPTDYTEFLGGPPSDGPIVDLHITGPGYTGADFTECELLCNSATSAGIEYAHSFFPNTSWNWFETDVYNRILGNFWESNYWEGITSNTVDFDSLFWGTVVDVTTRTYKAWQYDPTNGMYSYEVTFTSDGYVDYPAPGSGNYYVSIWESIDAYGGISAIEAADYLVEKVFGYIGDNNSLPTAGTPWDGTYIAGIFRPTKVPTDSQIMDLYNYYMGML